MSSHNYFRGLNYTLGNEDTSVEIALIKSLRPKKIFSICGSGGRSLPLMHEDCEELALSDLSLEQLQLAELRFATYKELSHDDFLLFWGYYPFSDNNHNKKRREIFTSLKLSDAAYAFFSQVFHETGYDSLLYLGKWERTFALFAKINQVLLAPEHDKIMRFDNLEDQIYYYRHQFPMTRWKGLIHLLGNKAMFNALLYKGDFIKKNSPLSHFDYYFQAFDRLFTKDLAQKSFFLHLCFYGKVRSFSGVPVEAQIDSFNRVKRTLGKVTYLQQDFINALSKGDRKFDFVSLSDVPSYFSGDPERQFMQYIRAGLNPGAVVVCRYYLRTAECILDGYDDITDDYREVIELEKVQMYNIKIYRFRG